MKKLAVITGASRGIGRHAAFYFAEQGFNLVLIAQNKSLLEQLKCELLNQFKIQIAVHPLDVSNLETVTECIAQTRRNFKTIDVLFNNAGVYHSGTSSLAPEHFNDLISVNLQGFYNLIHVITPLMIQQQSGYIFNLASHAATRPIARSGGYCMTKYGVLGYSQSLSLELINHHIKVTALCPGVVDTEMSKAFSQLPDEDKILCEDIIKTVDYLLHLSPNVAIDAITLKSTFGLKQEQLLLNQAKN